jgi:hypothetical protein
MKIIGRAQINAKEDAALLGLWRMAVRTSAASTPWMGAPAGWFAPGVQWLIVTLGLFFRQSWECGAN